MKVQAIVLAAGRGKRMKAGEKSKVMFKVGGKPMISFPIAALKGLGIEKPIVVVGHGREEVMSYLGNSVEFAVQEKVEGTGDAVRSAFPKIQKETEHVIVLYGDHSTFYTTEVLQQLMDEHSKTKAEMTLITTHTDPTGYGRILRDSTGEMVGIVEEKNATEEQKKITEINTGNAIYKTSFLQKYLPLIQRNEISGEYYFTDIVELGFAHKDTIKTLVVEDAAIGMGINTPEQLQAAEEEMRKRSS